MATAISLTPTEEKADCLRLLSLIVDGGTLVLRYNFNKAIPPSDLRNILNSDEVRTKLNKLWNGKFLRKKQWDLLYPFSDEPDSANFDVSLLGCLLRHICGLDEKSIAWDRVPPSFDESVEADIARLLQCRNEVSHMKSLTINKESFQRKWNKYEKVIVRLGAGVPNLNQEIQNLKDNSLDPVKEQAYLERIKEWQEMDESLKIDIAGIKTEVKDVVKEVESINESMSVVSKETICNTTKIENLEKRQQKESVLGESLSKDVLQHEDRLAEIESRHETLEHVVEKTKEALDEQTIIYERTADNARAVADHDLSMDRSSVVSSRVQHMSSVTKLYAADPVLDAVYVKTNAHRVAEKKLNSSGCVILSGLPGEGKTMMASKLLSETTTDGVCLKLSKPLDWDNLVLKKEKPLTIFIDDIFGAGALDQKLLEGWSRCLPDIEKAVKERAIKVIITTRHYILNEAKEKLRKITLLKDDNIQVLASFDLTHSERAAMLEAHLNHANRECSSDLIANCCKSYETAAKNIYKLYELPEDIQDYFPKADSETAKAMIGFPEIVSLFVQNEHLFTKGEAFFKQPALFFRKCVEELFLDEEKFLALILLWTRKDKRLKQLEIEPPHISDELKSTSMKFDISLEGKTTGILRRSLKYHSGGFLRFSSISGTYSFSHNTVKDMVGLVAGQEYTDAILEFADKEFIMRFITTDESKNDGLHIFIGQYRYLQLHKAVCRILKPDSSPATFFGDRTKVNRFGIAGVRSTQYGNTVDISVIKHDCFKNTVFVNIFCNSEEGKHIMSQPLNVSPETCFDWNCELQFEQTVPVYFPSLALLYRNKLLLMEFFTYFIIRLLDPDQFLQKTLLIASRLGLKDIVEVLLQYGATVSEEAIYFAAAKGREECLEYLLQNYTGDCNTCSSNINKNSPLIAAAKIGAVQSIKYLIRHGADVNYRNKHGWSALDKAVLYAQPESCKTLLDKNAQVNSKTGKFKRTPLHMNADIGNEEITYSLLQNGASLKAKDHRGHYPIHCAAFSCENRIVEILLRADVSETTLKHRVSYGKTSVVKGGDLFHIAVFKKNAELIDILLQHNFNPNVRDFYGRTPINRAVYEIEKKWLAENDPIIKIIEMLLCRADIQQADRNGYTPLHTAIHKGQRKIAKLIAPLSDVNALDKYGKSPLHTACEQLDLEVFKFLVEDCMADFRILTKSRQSVFDILAKKTEWRNIRRRYRAGKRVNTFMLEKPPYTSFRQIISAKDPDFANVNAAAKEEGDKHEK